MFHFGKTIDPLRTAVSRSMAFCNAIMVTESSYDYFSENLVIYKPSSSTSTSTELVLLELIGLSSSY